jgi:NAD(P)-dependent dehydrogenase (short-subunit alcohol dehydrogenase family)
MSSNAFRTVIDIDLIGTFNVFRAAYEHLRKPGASLVAISAPQATQPFKYQAHACAAKAGVNLLVQTLATEWGEDGIRVNAISPGFIGDTEGTRRLAGSAEQQQKINQSIALRRFGESTEIGAMVAFLATDAASYVSGAILDCNGGLALDPITAASV